MASAKSKQQFDLKTEATRPFFAAVGATDLAVEFARGYADDLHTRVNDVQDRVTKADFQPKALRAQARTLVAERVDEIGKDAKQAQGRVEAYVTDTVAEVSGAYGDLAERGQRLVTRIRRQQATQDATAAAKTTTAKAKTTRTQAGTAARKTSKSTQSAAKSTATKSSAPAKKSAKATSTAAKKTASTGAKAASDAAGKVGN